LSIILYIAELLFWTTTTTEVKADILTRTFPHNKIKMHHLPVALYADLIIGSLNIYSHHWSHFWLLWNLAKNLHNIKNYKIA